MYEDIKIIPCKKYSKIVIDSQFGREETFIGAIENVPDEIRSEMESYDRFYDLHIDSLKFTTYDFDWLRHFYTFPKPETVISGPGDYVLFHLASNLSDVHQLEKWYSKRLVEQCSKFIKCKLIVTDKTKDFLIDILSLPNIETIEGNLEEISKEIGAARAFVGIDSGLKYIAYAFSVPVICFSKHSTQPYRVLPSHKIRWMPFETDCFPLNFDTSCISKTLEAILENKAASIIPYSAAGFDNIAIFRKYQLNETESILNGN